MRASLLLLLFAASCATCASTDGAAPRARAVTVLFTADLWGQLEPCGCSADMRGGLDRAAAYVKARRAAGPTLLVDAGDALFDARAYAARDEVQASRRADAAAAALLEMGVDAKASYERDLALPRGPFPDAIRLAGWKVLEAGGVKVGLVEVDALAQPGAAPPLAERARRARDAGADVVLAVIHAPRSQAIALAAAAAGAGVDAIVGSHVETIAEGEEARAVRAEVPVFFTQGRGQSLLELEVVLRAGGGAIRLAPSPAERDDEIESIGARIQAYERRIVALPGGADPAPFRAKIEELRARRRQLADEEPRPPAEGSYLAYRFVPITEDRSADPAVEAILARYDREVAEANLAWARANPAPCPEPAEGEARHVGAAACAACHRAAAEHFATTKHALAYATLERAGKQYDLSCVSCHVTGWERPGGVCDVARVEGRKDVTCESCHGPGSAHVADPAGARLPAQVPEATCRTCHTREHSTAFEHATYRARIVGPGHGRPAGGP